jgi:hypothetical protein
MYKLIKNSEGLVNVVQRIVDNTFIPFAPDNVDFQQYQKWLSEGNQPLPADEPNA